MALAAHDKVKVALPLVGGIAAFTGFMLNSTGRSQLGNIFFAFGAVISAISASTIVYSMICQKKQEDALARDVTRTNLRFIN